MKLSKAKVKDLEADNSYQKEVINTQIEENLYLNYKIVALKEHVKQKNGDKDTFIEHLSELSEELIVLRSQRGKAVVEEG